MSVKGWHLKQLDEVGTIFSGSTPSTTNRIYWNGEITWVTPNDLSQLNTPYLTNSAKKITAQGLKGCSAKLLPPCSIILSSRAPIGYIAINTIECCTNQGCKSFVLKPEYNPEFVYYNLKFNINKIKNLGEGTTFAEISKTALAKVEMLFLENRAEQKKIAEVLSTVDRAIAQTEALIAKQQRIKTGLMQDLLTKGIDENGNIRSEETHEFKDSAIGRIPVEWEVVAIGQVTKSLVPGRDKPNLDGGGIPWITIPDIDSLYISSSKNNLSLSPKAIKNANARLMPKSTVLMSCVGEFGIATITTKDVVTNQQLHGFICENDILPEWLTIQLNASGHRIENRATQTTIKYLNKIGCESIPIALPCLAEQKKTIMIVDNSLSSIALQKNYLSKLIIIKTALMQDLLTGKVRVIPLLENLHNLSQSNL